MNKINDVCKQWFGYEALGTVGYLALGTGMGTISSLAQDVWINGPKASGDVKTAIAWSAATSAGILFALSPKGEATAKYCLWNQNNTNNVWIQIGVKIIVGAGVAAASRCATLPKTKEEVGIAVTVGASCALVGYGIESLAIAVKS